MPSSQGSWEDSIKLINAPQVPCVVHGTKEIASEIVIEQGNKMFKQMIWTSHFPSFGTSVSLLGTSLVHCLNNMVWETALKRRAKANSFAQISFFASAFLRPFHNLIFSWL